MNLNDWALQWAIPAAAMLDLRARMGQDGTAPYVAPTGIKPHTEAFSTSQIRLEAAPKRVRLWRNLVGAGYMDDGSFVRFGLANESDQMNKLLKSSDLIGIDGRPIEQREVGLPRGRFVAREMKAPGWVYTATEREVAQRAFGLLVTALGGDFAFATGPGSL